jgi:hypothetical protein
MVVSPRVARFLKQAALSQQTQRQLKTAPHAKQTRLRCKIAKHCHKNDSTSLGKSLM